MTTAEFWVKIGKWFLDITPERKVIVLFLAVLGLIVYDNTNLREENAEHRRNDSISNNRNDSIKALLQKEIKECEAEKLRIVQETSEHWSKKYEEMEKRLYKEYETVEKIKRRR